MKKNLKCYLGYHEWTAGKGYHESYCSRCQEWYYFENAEDSPQGKGKMAHLNAKKNE